ncbi:bacteriocin immunity protein [Streptococcus salivarius]|uniref:Bacteriocin immunity protein n=1 Tax=Streptococcus salivarius TaxID=1304 RepID=A0AAX2V4P4_STRSL|nr:bacteriocin immunity protein [Streptococcus salivarius]TNF68691.1 bacteriocin immunity protein [Streptococcus salivarius]
MTKSNNTQITDILNNIYNLIVNPETTEKERKLLVTFKNEIEVGKKDNDELLAELRRAIQGLAVRNLSKGISLSSGVSELSKTLTKFQDKSERNINLARGLSSSLVMLFR